MQLCIEDDHTLVFLKTTFDEEFRAYSPGVLMRIEIFRHVFDEGRIRRIELYGALKEWQLKWVTETRTMYHVNCYRSALVRKAKALLANARAVDRGAVLLTPQAARRSSTASIDSKAPASPGTAAANAAPDQSGVVILRDGRHSVVAYEGFAALPASATATFERGSVRDLFFSAGWFRTLSAHGLDPHDRVRIYAVEDVEKPGQALALLPMLHPSPAAGTGPRPIRGLQNYYASLFGPIVRADAGNRRPLFQVLAKGLVADPLGWTEIDLHPLDRGDPSYEDLATALADAGLVVHRYFCFGNWYLDVADRSYAQCLAGMPSKLRHTLIRRSKAFARLPAATIEIVTAGSGLNDAIAAYRKVYAASWKVPEPHPDFIPALIRDCANDGSLRLGLAWVDREPIAAQIWIVREGIAYIYKLAYDKRHAKLSAGTILTGRLLQHVIDVDRVREVDYLTGDDAYKQDWMSARRERWGILAYNPRTLSGLGGAAKSLASRFVKRFTDGGPEVATRSKL